MTWAHFKSHKIKIIAIVYWESVNLMIFSTEWIFHARWWSLYTLPNILHPIFHVWLSTSERRSVNPNSNLIKLVILPQLLRNITVLKAYLSILSQHYYFNAVWIVANTSPFTCIQSNMKYWIQYVRQGVQGSSTSVEYSFRTENHQFDTISAHDSNYLNPETFELCSFCLSCVLTQTWLDGSISISQRSSSISVETLLSSYFAQNVLLLLKSYAILIGGGGGREETYFLLGL